MKRPGFRQKVFLQVSKIPRGKVKTYGQIAKTVGSPGAARAVGNALHCNRLEAICCHRVVNKEGKVAKNFAFGGALGQRKKLLKEGVAFRGKFRVDLAKHLLKE